MQKLGEGAKALTSSISKLFREMQPNYLGVYSPIHCRFVITSASGGRKNKRTELNDKRLTLFHAKVGGEALVSPLTKMLDRRVPPRPAQVGYH